MKNLILLIACFAFITTGAIAQKSRHAPIKVLIVDGFSNHNWQQTTKMVKGILEETGLFKVDVSTTPATPTDSAWAKWRPNFSQYQVVIQNCNNIGNNKAMHWPREVQVALENYVKGGGGLYILHSANNAFPEWDEYNVMIGLGWRSAKVFKALMIDSAGKNIVEVPVGTGINTTHGKRFDAVIQKFTSNPINQDYPAAWKTPSMELYKYPRGPAQNLTVLSFCQDSVSHINWPVEWVVQYGKGRVYNSSMGHLWADEVYPLAYRCVGFQTTMIRVTQWLATGKVSYPLPKNFPTATQISVRDEADVPHSRN